MSRRMLIAMTVVGVAAIAVAQETHDLKLRGDRFAPLTWETLNGDQRTMVADLLAGSRTSLNGPFNVLLRSPIMGNHAQKLGDYLRFHTAVPAKLNEMAIIMTARAWSSQYEFVGHRTRALNAGLDPAVVDDIQAGRRPSKMQEDETVVYDFCTELRERKRVSDATFSRAKALLGERGVVDLIGVMGYYDLVAMALNVDRYPLPAGTPAPFTDQ